MKKVWLLKALILACLLPGAGAEAAPITVNVATEAELRTALQNLASEDIGTIVIDAAITLALPLPLQVSPDAELTIQSGMEKVIDGGGNPLFRVMKGTVTFQGLTLSNGGGTTTAAVTLDKTPGGTPKAIFSGVTFSENKAGAVMVGGGTTAEFVNSTTFTKNSATSNGGAVSIAAGAEATFSGSEFEDNSSTLSGGAVHVAAGAKATFSGAKFKGNTSAFSGGAIHITTGAEATFSGSEFEGNTSTLDGGAVHIATGAKATFSGAKFKNNTAASGGAVNILTGGKATFSGSEFEGNTSTLHGGAVHVTGTGTAEFSGVTPFRDNGATGNGGAVYLNGAAVEFPSTVSFEHNSAGNGGAVALSDSASSKATFNGNTLSPNTAAANGGSLHIPGSATVVFKEDQSFLGNSAANGGAIWANALTLTTGKVLNFRGNTATNNGGAVYLSGTTTLPDGLVFETNSADLGGAVYANATLTVAGGVFFDNEALSSGGAIHAAAAVTVSGGDFASNEAGTSGGAIYTDGTARVTGGTFEMKNEAKAASGNAGGGAIYASGDITIEPSETDSILFANQEAQQDGGALYSAKNVKAENVIFKDNSAKGSGGAVLAGGTITLTKTEFSGNTSSKAGGALYAKGEGKSTIQESVFSGNKAVNGDGGAIALLKSGAVFEMVSSAMLNNNAGGAGSSGQGGALWLYVEEAVIKGSTFHDNHSKSNAEGQGGAVRLQASSQSTLENNTFTKNTVTGNTSSYGGALWLSGPINLMNCTLSLENEAMGTDKRGGGIYIASGKAAFAGVLAVGNKADQGADIFNKGERIRSDGYNRIGLFGEGESNTLWNNSNLDGDTETDRQQDTWTSATFFGSETLNDNSGPSIGPESARIVLQTLALNEADALAVSDRAMDKIPVSRSGFPAKDQRGVDRPQPTGGMKDIGAFEVVQSGGGSTDPDDGGALTIKSIQMSGIPNSLTRVGQTAGLKATVTYLNGTTSNKEPVIWTSTHPSVAHIDEYGNIYTRSTGTTTITVTVKRDKTVGDSKTLEVAKEMTTIQNVHPNVWSILDDFNMRVSARGAALDLEQIDRARVMASAFSDPFKKAWRESAALTDLNSDLSSTLQFTSGTLGALPGWSPFKIAMGVSLTGRGKGHLLPLKYRWSLSWDEVSTLLGRKVMQVKTEEERNELFSTLRLAFTSVNGAIYDVVGGDGVSAADAGSRGALKLTNGNNGLTLELTALVANVSGASARASANAAASTTTGPQLINRLLVVPDGVADKTISGTLGLLSKTAASGGGGSGGGSNGGDDGKGGGGGGCAAGTARVAWLLLALPTLLRRKR